MRTVIAGLDVGDYSVKLVVGEYVRGKLNILAVSETPSKGMKKGLLVDPNAMMEPLKKVFAKAEELIGIPIKKAVVSVPGNYAEFAIGEGTLEITNEDKVVRGEDISKVLGMTAKGHIASNMELVSVIPTVFRVDDKTISDPKKMIGSTLYAKSVLVSIPKKDVYPILSCLEKLGIEATDICVGSIADYYAHVSDDIKDFVGALVNIGGATTTVSIFNKGVLTNMEVIELGGENIDNDLSFIYKLTKNDAVKIKENLALANKRLALASEVRTCTTKLGESIRINQYEASEIVMSRLEEILNLSKKQINLLTKKEIRYIIFTGGVTESTDFGLTLEGVFGKNVTLGVIEELGVRNNKYATAVGLIKYYYQKMKFRNREFSIFTIEEQEELSNLHKRMSIAENSVLGKLFGYFFDN